MIIRPCIYCGTPTGRIVSPGIRECSVCSQKHEDDLGERLQAAERELTAIRTELEQAESARRQLNEHLVDGANENSRLRGELTAMAARCGVLTEQVAKRLALEASTYGDISDDDPFQEFSAAHINNMLLDLAKEIRALAQPLPARAAAMGAVLDDSARLHRTHEALGRLYDTEKRARETAEHRCNELRIEIQQWKDAAYLSDSGIGMEELRSERDTLRAENQTLKNAGVDLLNERDELAARCDKLVAEIHDEVAKAIVRTHALKAAKQFIENGIEMGYIRMPDPSTPDAAHNTLPAIIDAISTPLPARAAAMGAVAHALSNSDVAAIAEVGGTRLVFNFKAEEDTLELLDALASLAKLDGAA